MNTPKLPPLPAHPEPRIMTWSDLEERVIREYGEACAIAAIAAQGVPDGWQPIKTAPKDGTLILLATPKGRIADGNWHQKYGVWSWPYVMVEPTLWRPLPSAQIADAPPAPQGPQVDYSELPNTELPGMWDQSDFLGGATDCDAATPAPQAGSPKRPSADWYKAKIMETLDDDFNIGPAPQATVFDPGWPFPVPNVSKYQTYKCQTCSDSGMIGVGNPYAQNGGGVPCPDCKRPKQAKPQPLSDEKIFALADPFGAFEYGDAQGDKRKAFARAVESAACAERDARIAELERQLAEARKDAGRLDYIQRTGSTVELLQGSCFRVGGLYRTSSTSIRQAIDNAMQKG